MNVCNEKPVYSVVTTQSSISVGKTLKCRIIADEETKKILNKQIITSLVQKISYLNDDFILVHTQDANYKVLFDPKYINFKKR